MPKLLLRWLRGQFICRHCGQFFSIPSFGFGEIICPDCYSGEESFVFFDNTYFLNRLLRIFADRGFRGRPDAVVEATEALDPQQSKPSIPYIQRIKMRMSGSSITAE